LLDIDNFVNGFANIGKLIFYVISNLNALYFATFLFLLFLLYAIFLALISLVPGFGSEKKANKYGKVVAFTIALISCLSIYYFGKNNDMQAVVERVLPIYGIFGGAVLAIFFFGIIYFGFGNKEEGRWQLALAGSGLLLAISGYFITQPSVQALGWLAGAIGLILYISSIGIVKESKKEH
jgi:hypothetical protein